MFYVKLIVDRMTMQIYFTSTPYDSDMLIHYKKEQTILMKIFKIMNSYKLQEFYVHNFFITQIYVQSITTFNLKKKNR